MYTTLNKIHEHNPCKSGWNTLLAHLGKTEPDDEPLSLLTILNSNGLEDALWALRATNGHEKAIRAFAIGCLERTRHLIRHPALADALATVERYARGLASEEERAEAKRFALEFAVQPFRYGIVGKKMTEMVWCVAIGKGRGEPVGLAAVVAVLSFGYPSEREIQDAELRCILSAAIAAALALDFSREIEAQEAELRRILNA